MPLFCHDALLVHSRSTNNAGWEVHVLGTKGGRLTPRRVILCGPNSSLPEWCVANDALVAWNLEPDNLTIYKIL